MIWFQLTTPPMISFGDGMAQRATPLRETEAAPSLPRIEGGFKTILADPPWSFTNRTGKVVPEQWRLDRYSTMELADI